MFNTYQSHSLKQLAEHFSEIFEPDASNPFTQPWVIVKNNEIKEWLSLQYARENEIAGNFRFIFPSEFLWTLYRLKNKEVPQVLPSDLNAMHWALLELISNEPGLLKEIPFYDLNSDDPQKRFQFCAQLADNFDQYQVYRPLMMERWLDRELVTKHKDERWQAAIWKRLNEIWQSSSKSKYIPRRSQAFTELLQWLNQGTPDFLDQIPESVYIFGLSHTPQSFLEIISKIGKVKEVHFFSRKTEEQEPSAALASLLQKWNKPSKEQLELLENTLVKNNAEYSFENLRDAKANLPDLMVHSCHNKRREVQVLKDQILRFLDKNPDCTPSEMLVMVPDAESYAGILETVFENEEDEPALPLSRLSRGAGQSAEHTLAELLELFSTSFKASSVLQFMNLEPVKQRFSFSEAELDLIEQWVLDNKIHWGLGEEFNTTYSWQKGINQLISGFAMQPERLDIYEGLVPFSEITSSDDAELTARFSRLIYFFKKTSKEISVPKKPFDWLVFTEQLVKNFIGEEGGNSTQKTGLFVLINKLKEQTAYAPGNHTISFGLIKSWLIGQLEAQSSASGRFGQGITVSSYVPYRSVPFRFIAVLGMNEGIFPRKAIRPEFDLIYASPQPGDRILKEDDTYLFLETIQAAQNHLHLSFQGQDQRTDSIRLPSILIQQLLDVIYEKPGDAIIRHSLHPFNSRYFSRKEGSSYSGSNQKLAEKMRNISPEGKNRFISHDFSKVEEEEIDRIHISDLISFFTHPCKYFLQNQLDLKNYDEFNEIIDREQFKMGGLDRYKLDHFIFQSLAKNETTEQVYEYAKAAAMIPESLQGAKSFEREKEGIRELLKSLEEKTSGDERKEEISFQLERVEIHGSVSGIYADTLVSYRVGKHRAKHEIEHWLKHLALLEAGVFINKSLYLSKDGAEVDILEISSAGIHQNPLAQYVKWFLMSSEVLQKLAFFPESSKAFADAFLDKQDKEKAIGKARSKWEDGKFKSFAESTDFFNELIWRNFDPLATEDFHKNALKFWEPLFTAREGKV